MCALLLLLLHCDVLCCALCALCCQPVMCLCVGVLLTLEVRTCPLKLPPPASCGPSRHPPSPTLSSDACVVHSTLVAGTTHLPPSRTARLHLLQWKPAEDAVHWRWLATTVSS